MSALVLTAVDRESSSAAACVATWRSGCVRRRATVGGAKLRGRDGPVLQRREQRERGSRALEESIEHGCRVRAGQGGYQHGIHIGAGGIARGAAIKPALRLGRRGQQL